ncbi:hypothetical protein BO71DRAFT_434263 [Aspergillus ellipticus CBS 707.79]|uniref:NAD(P)-binding protein n=1 Tax=Aspergillus ellipticus CBS 707.79 TaxID=1448320 RepID=A0A319CXG0_9EURO|nr:hypothetical protein BO71DRAFT_434263 [Aspergillus ellipticus CBS 707.79]
MDGRRPIERIDSRVFNHGPQGSAVASSWRRMATCTDTDLHVGSRLPEVYGEEHPGPRPHTTVVAAVRDPSSPTSQALQSLPTGPSSRVIVVKIDSTSPEDPAAAVATLQAEHGIAQLDVVIANAGICEGPALKPVHPAKYLTPARPVSPTLDVIRRVPECSELGADGIFRAWPQPGHLMISPSPFRRTRPCLVRRFRTDWRQVGRQQGLAGFSGWFFVDLFMTGHRHLPRPMKHDKPTERRAASPTVGEAGSGPMPIPGA